MGAEWVSAIAAVVASVAGIIGLVIGRRSRPTPAPRWRVATVGSMWLLVENDGEAPGYILTAHASGGSPRTDVLVKPGEAIELSHGGFSPWVESAVQISWTAKPGGEPESWVRPLMPQSD